MAVSGLPGLAGQPVTTTSFIGMTSCVGTIPFTVPPKQTNDSFWKAIYILINEEMGNSVYGPPPVNSQEYVVFHSTGMGFYRCSISDSTRRMLSSDLRTIDL